MKEKEPLPDGSYTLLKEEERYEVTLWDGKKGTVVGIGTFSRDKPGYGKLFLILREDGKFVWGGHDRSDK